MTREAQVQHRRPIPAALIAAVLIALSPAAAAQVGEQPIRIVFPFAAGGSGDALARLIADRMRAALNRPVIVENRTGAAGRLGVQAVKNAAPDGSTLLLTPIAPMAVFQHVYSSLEYDPFADFEPLAQLGTFDFGVAIGAQVPAKSLKELIEWAKANPGNASYGIPAAGSLPHFLGVLIARAAGLDLRPVAYRGSAAALADLVAGHIPMMVTTTSDLVQMHKAGRIRILATSDRERSPFVIDVPTLREAGYELEATGWYGMFAPARTPAPLLERYSKLVVAAIDTPELQKKLAELGLHATGTSPAAFAAIQRRDSQFWAPAVKASGFTPQQ
jgi:tripartite-type tricarboxylate transporter receptor subunit TctC